MNIEAIYELIEETKRSKATALDLANTGLKQIPPEIFELTNLEELSFADNEITNIPEGIENLRNLKLLSLRGNKFTDLPEEITRLHNLQVLYLSNNEITHLPPTISGLENLRHLYLADNFLHKLPDEIGRLVHLQRMILRGNSLEVLSPSIGKLTGLQIINLENNRLTELPAEVGNLIHLQKFLVNNNRLSKLPSEIGNLSELQIFEYLGNPLNELPPEVVAQGKFGLLSYLRERSKGSRRQWKSKLLIVGEGGTGKTSLLRSLRNEPFLLDLSSTHGLEVQTLRLEHPKKANVIMDLNSWDFGGQQIYHATHQFFLTNRSLFILVWNARLGYEQGKLYYWLETIKARAPESPILIVATSIDERDAALPFTDIRHKYSQVVGYYRASNKTGDGIKELRSALSDAASQLPLMGEEWPISWFDAASAVRKKEDKFVIPDELNKIIAAEGVSLEYAPVLVHWLHELGDILYFPEDIELSNIVILKPQWVAQYISKVLDSEEVITKQGIFTHTHMNELWSDIPYYMREHFLRLMEKFDISYRTLEDREISLVVERLPLDQPLFEDQWDSMKNNGNSHEISMKFYLSSIPPGIPTWFIARSHRFTTYTHWRTGVLLCCPFPSYHLALVQAYPHERYVQLTVRGPNPQNFFVLLKDCLELTFQRYPGLNIKRTVPCPGHDNAPCPYEFSYEALQKAIEKEHPILQVQCQATFEMVSVTSLLFGLHWRTQVDVLKRINEIEDINAQRHNELITLLQREFLKNYRLEQSRAETECPNVFVLHPIKSLSVKRIAFGAKLELQLYCQAPGCWHPTVNGGRYTINYPAKWLRKLGGYIQTMITMLKYITPFMGPWVGMVAPAYAELVKNDIKFMEELVKIIPEVDDDDENMSLSDNIGKSNSPDQVKGAELRVLRQLLDELDPQQRWGDLRKTPTPEGHYLWLCEQHAKEFD